MVAIVPSRELRNDTAGVLRRVESGEEIVITVRGKAVAELVPVRQDPSKRWFSKDELLDIVENASADSGLRSDLDRLAGETTDDLPIR